MADNFNLTGFLKKNQLLNENIGGYRDIQPVKEAIGTAMEEDESELKGAAADARALFSFNFGTLIREVIKEGDRGAEEALQKLQNEGKIGELVDQLEELYNALDASMKKYWS